MRKIGRMSVDATSASFHAKSKTAERSSYRREGCVLVIGGLATRRRQQAAWSSNRPQGSKIRPTLRYAGMLAAIGEFASDDGGHGRSPKTAAIERGIAGLTGRVVDIVSPLVRRGENCDIRGGAGRYFALHAENAGRARGEQFHHTCQRNL